jgi:TolA-binding protein
MAATFRQYAERYPNDPYTPTAQRFIADALYRSGQYAEAQQQWETAQQVAAQSGRRALADSIARLQQSAAASFGDTLVRRGEYRRAAEDVYVAFAERNPNDPQAPDALRNAIESYMLADSVARARGDQDASRQARERAAELSGRLVSQYPRYRYRAQYQTLQARLFTELGRQEEAVAVLRSSIADLPAGPARADAMVRLAVALDSLGRDRESAQAYEEFSAAFPRDQRAADAQYNAAVLYREAGDQAAAARAFGTFATRFPRDRRVAEARTARVALLRAAGDSAAAGAELTRLCANPTAELRAECAARAGEAAFRQGVAMWPQYRAERLVIRTASALTQAGVQRASARKQQLLRTMSGHFTRAIRAGAPEWLSAATYYVGLAQWEYGEFVKNVQLPEGLPDDQRQAALQGAEQQAQQYYNAARQTWHSLVDKATEERFGNVWVDRAREAMDGRVPENPPTSRRPAAPAQVGGTR